MRAMSGVTKLFWLRKILLKSRARHFVRIMVAIQSASAGRPPPPRPLRSSRLTASSLPSHQLLLHPLNRTPRWWKLPHKQTKKSRSSHVWVSTTSYWKSSLSTALAKRYSMNRAICGERRTRAGRPSGLNFAQGWRGPTSRRDAVTATGSTPP